MLDERAAFKPQLKRFEYDFDDGGWIWARAAATQFIDAGASETLDSQASRIATWTAPALTGLLSLKPGRHPG